MFIYEKWTDGDNGKVRHAYGTLNNLPGANDSALTYKDEAGNTITPTESDTYRTDNCGGIVRDSDGKAVRAFIGDTCVVTKMVPRELGDQSAAVAVAEVVEENDDDVTTQADSGDDDEEAPAKASSARKIDIADCKVTVSYKTTTANGKAKEPKVTVTGLTLNEDYIVAYSDNIEPGTATVTVSGIGNYIGTVVKTFTIVEK